MNQKHDLIITPFYTVRHCAATTIVIENDISVSWQEKSEQGNSSAAYRAVTFQLGVVKIRLRN